MTVALNPGFAILAAAALALVLPRTLRTAAMIVGALAALFLIFEPDFGAGPAFAQIGLTITPLRLDPLAQIFGIGFAITTAILSLFSAQRADRAEDVALMALAGGALVAVFAGDMVSFVASAQFAALAGGVLIFLRPGSDALGAGLRYLSWQALAGALMAAGVGLSWAMTGAIGFDKLSARTWQGALMFAGMAIMAGAPIAHVWLKDSLPRTSALGGAALAAFGVKLGLYALARAFPGEPILIFLGAATAIGAIPLAALTQDVRQAGAYGVISQSGAVMAAIGAGTPLALAGAAALSFASLFHATLGLLTIGLACERVGGREGALGGLARSMPVTALLAIVAGLSTMAAPGFVGFSAATIHADALSQQDRPLVWLAVLAASAGGAVHFGARLPWVVFFGPDKGARPADAPFPAQLAMGLAAFFCFAIGVAPSWMYGLLPSQIYFHPYDWEHLVRRSELIAFSWFAVFGAVAMKFFPADKGRELADVDWLFRTAGKPALRRSGVALLALYDLGRSRLSQVYLATRRIVAVLTREGDRPAAPDGADLIWVMVVLIIAMVFLFAFQG